MHTPKSNQQAGSGARRGERERTSSAQRPGAAPWYKAKYSATQENQGLQRVYWSSMDQETGEIIPLIQEETALKKRSDPRETRLERYALQGAARRLLWGSRTGKCLRVVRARRKDEERAPVIEVFRSAGHGSTHYGGLQTCGSVWACPVCAAKVSERRRVGLLSLMEQHKAGGGQCLLLTLTFSHSFGDDIAKMLKAQASAWDVLNKNRAGRALWDSLGTVGTVRALEVTHGANGWHPHFHVLIFCAAGVDREQARQRFFDLWSVACVKFGLGAPSSAHGVRLDGGEHASAYVTKGLWGLDHEMTKGHIKKASKGRSPFDLLRSYLYDDDKQAGALFREYAQAFHGKRQLQYSNGLKKLYQVEDLTDEELAALQEEPADLLGQIELDQWRLILAADLRGEVLELARHGWEPVARLLASLEDQQRRRVDDRIKREKDITFIPSSFVHSVSANLPTKKLPSGFVVKEISQSQIDELADYERIKMEKEKNIKISKDRNIRGYR